MSNKNLQFYFFLALFGLVLALNVAIFLPFLKLFAVVAIFAVVLHPLYERTVVFLRNRNLSAFLTVLLAVIIVLIPIVFFISRIWSEAHNLSLNIGNINNTLAVISAQLTHSVGMIAPSISIDLSSYIGTLFRAITGSAGNIFSSIFRFIPFLFLGFVSLFFFLRDGRKFLDIVIKVSPLSDMYDNKILEKQRKAISAIVKGSLLVAGIQGLLTGIGFWIFGVPNPALWGGLTVFAALIPGIGTALIIIPAVVYLLSIKAVGLAIGLGIWGVIIVGLIDNLARPIFVGKDVDIHPFLVLMSVFGGLIVFGPLGFLLGPLVLSLLYALVDIYPAISEHFSR